MDSGLSRQNSEFLSHIQQFPQSFALAPPQTERRREQPFCLFVFIFFIDFGQLKLVGIHQIWLNFWHMPGWNNTVY